MKAELGMQWISWSNGTISDCCMYIELEHNVWNWKEPHIMRTSFDMHPDTCRKLWLALRLANEHREKLNQGPMFNIIASHPEELGDKETMYRVEFEIIDYAEKEKENKK